MRIVELQTRPLTEAAPTPNTIGKEKDTIIAQQVSATEVELYVTDDRGKVLKARTGSASGGGGGTTPTLQEVLTAGNELGGKEIVGDLNVISESPIDPSEYYNLSATKDGYILESKSDIRNYSSMLQIGTATGAIRHDFSYPVTRGRSSGYLDLGARGIDLKAETIGHEEGFQFKANSDELRYQGYIDGEGVSHIFNKNGVRWTMPNLVEGGLLNLNYTNDEGLFGTKYFTPTREEHYVQKKYVDELLGGKPAVTIDRMYLNYAGKLAIDITVTGLGTKASDPNVFKDSKIEVDIFNRAGDPAHSYGFGTGSKATISIIEGDSNKGVCKAHIELESENIKEWSNYHSRIFEATYLNFTYIPDAASDPSTWVKSGKVYYGEKYTYGQSGVVGYKIKTGKQSQIHSSTTEYSFFAIDDSMFDLESHVGQDYNYKFGWGVPFGSYDTDSGKILADNRIMPNPTPGQVTDWELTIELSGNNLESLTADGYRAVIYDANDVPLNEVPIFPFTGGIPTAQPQEAKVTLRTVNSFNNIIGNNRGFKLGIRCHNANSGLDINFGLKHIRRISHSVA